ncbi:MAG: hypothetical protein IPF58_16500 [Saprospirales bacterium]|nr:hypothetical protein [Saprospirales bacterium]
MRRHRFARFLFGKVWSYSKNAKVAIEQAKKNAVHGIVFKGFAGSGQICPSQKALAPEVGVEDKHKDYFEKFFKDGGDYMKYVSVSGDGIPQTIKVGKEYKIGIIVSVMKDALRKDLEVAGVIKSYFRILILAFYKHHHYYYFIQFYNK